MSVSMKFGLACSPALLAALFLANPAVPAQEEQESRPIPPAIGPHVGFGPEAYKGVPSFNADDRVVMTHYFYWYDSETGAHFHNPGGSDALTTHPTRPEGYSYKLPSWHKAQLEDMIAAGIDVVLPVYWGAPSEHNPRSHHHWSFEGLKAMVAAMEQLEREGKTPPRVGLFYDTSTLQHNSWGYHADLRTKQGKEWFAASIRDFFSLIPPKRWALIKGRPVVVLYSAGFAKGHDPSLLDHLRGAFSLNFGGLEPYVIREVSWNLRAENVYAWGGAVKPNFLGVAEIGPGYDHSAVPGREPLVTERRGGVFYEEAWLKALRVKPSIVIIETWNEHHEGTDIADSREYGRQYIDLTRKYVDLFKTGWTPPAVKGPYTGAKEVEILLGENDNERGLKRVEVEDGKSVPARIGGKACRRLLAGAGRAHYLYFEIDDSFKWAKAMDVVVEVEYHEEERNVELQVQYDRDDPSAAFGGAYTQAKLTSDSAGARPWRIARFELAAARFAGLQNGGADFRLVVVGPDSHVRRVVVQRATESLSDNHEERKAQ